MTTQQTALSTRTLSPNLIESLTTPISTRSKSRRRILSPITDFFSSQSRLQDLDTAISHSYSNAERRALQSRFDEELLINLSIQDELSRLGYRVIFTPITYPHPEDQAPVVTGYRTSICHSAYINPATNQPISRKHCFHA
jgi:hypothetical protein